MKKQYIYEVEPIDIKAGYDSGLDWLAKRLKISKEELRGILGKVNVKGDCLESTLVVRIRLNSCADGDYISLELV